MDVLAIVASPRRDGNTSILVDEIVRGVSHKHAEAKTEKVFLDDYITYAIRDCKRCRNSNGKCTIEDRYEELLLNVLKADYLILGSPLYWYGPSGQLKIFFDRWFCYLSDSYPGSRQFIEGLKGKKVVLAITSEENWPGLHNNLIGMVIQTLDYMAMILLAAVIGDNSGPRGQVRENERAMRDAYWIGCNIDRLQQLKMNIWKHGERPQSLEE